MITVFTSVPGVRLARAVWSAVVITLRAPEEDRLTVTGYYRRARRWSALRRRYKLRWLREKARADRLEHIIESTIAHMRETTPDLAETSFR